MLNIDKLSRTPLYEQVIEQFESLIRRGALEPSKQLPSVRTLSEQLAINPNTLQKAYTELERRGVCLSVPGTGRFVAPGAAEAIRARGLEKLDEFEELAKELCRAGAAKQLLLQAVERAFNAHVEDKE